MCTERSDLRISDRVYEVSSDGSAKIEINLKKIRKWSRPHKVTGFLDNSLNRFLNGWVWFYQLTTKKKLFVVVSNGTDGIPSHSSRLIEYVDSFGENPLHFFSQFYKRRNEIEIYFQL